MPEEPTPGLRQEAAAARDVYIAGRDQIIVRFGGAGPAGSVRPALLPRDVPGFTGRADELAVLAALTGGGRVVVTAIGGTVGVGKTALAVHAAHQLLPRFPGGHLYADLRGYTAGQQPAEPGEVLDVFLRGLGVPGEEMPAGVDGQSSMLRSLLARRRVLMVLDNVRTEAQVRPLLPGAGESLVLVTSRSLLPGLEADARITLDALPDEEAVAMLATVIGAPRAQAESQAVQELAGLCGRLPLALRVAGQLLAVHPRWPVTRLTAMLTEEQGRLAQLGAGDLQVRAAFTVSYAQLPAADARLFRLLGLHPGPEFTVDAATALAGIEAGAAEQALDRLAGAHLVTAAATAWYYRLHDLLHLYARGACEDTDDHAAREAAQARLVSYYVLLAAGLDACSDAVERPGLAQEAANEGMALPSVPEALAAFSRERPRLLAAISLATQHGWDEQVRLLGASLTGPLRTLRDVDDLLSVTESALSAARRGGTAADRGIALANVGNAYLELRRFPEARDCFEQALAIFRDAADQRREAMALNSLGTAAKQLRHWDEAVGYYQQALALFRAAGNQLSESRTLNNLGDTYRELGQPDAVIDCYQRSLDLGHEVDDPLSEGQALHNLGVFYLETGRLAEAADCHQRAVEIYREIGHRRYEGRGLVNLGADYLALRRFEEALRSQQEAVEIHREAGDRWDEGAAEGNLGLSYRHLRRLDEAEAAHQRSVAAFRDTGDRLSEGQALNNLGVTYLSLRRAAEAIDCFEAALAIAREVGDRSREAAALHNLAGLYDKTRRRDQAATYYQDAAVAYRDCGALDRARLMEKRAAKARPRFRRR